MKLKDLQTNTDRQTLTDYVVQELKRYTSGYALKPLVRQEQFARSSPSGAHFTPRLTQCEWQETLAR